jgi:hypothetical protein
MAEVEELGTWAYTLEEMTATATKVERVKRGIILKSGGLC